ncbi:unnamed protein product [Amoebophrya sp. A25]|nr:unnamed protein product [Amoebophrya sp. A25]|eukprot:GSA25T00023673001.1
MVYSEQRCRLSDVPFAGRVVSWKGNYGWIEALEPIDHPQLDLHQGRIFCHAEDLLGKSKRRLRPGVICEFFLYQDSQGLGAEQVIARQVVRILLPIAEGKRIFSEDGANVPEFEDRHNVSVRAFEWYNEDGTPGVLPFLVEFWGRPEGIVTAIRELRSASGSNLDFLVPQSRVNLLDLQKLHRMSGCSIHMSNLTAIDDPMPCYPLSCEGSDEALANLVLGLIDQICDPS